MVRFLQKCVSFIKFCYYYTGKELRKMETIANRIVDYLDTDKTIWNDIERMQMVLGLQVLIHNVIMIGTILFSTALTGMFWEAVILFMAYGTLKITVGGVHFQTSVACLVGTETFVMIGVMVSRRLDINLLIIIMIYMICSVAIMVIGPQGTENNPISEKNYKKCRKKALFIIFVDFIITLFLFPTNLKNVPYLLLIAIVFETLSILPSFIKNLTVKNLYH